MDAPQVGTQAPAAVLPRDGLEALFAELARQGYEVRGPTLRDGTIVHAPITGSTDLPHGVGDEQRPGHYRTTDRADGALFGYAVGPTSAKRELFPPRQPLWSAVSVGDADFEIIEAERVSPRVALFGLRPCELAAIAVQDRVLLHGAVVDEVYTANRADVLLIGVECGDPAATCFCTSMGTGPGTDQGADLLLTELLDGEHRFLVRAPTAAGQAIIDALDATTAVTEEDRTARAAVLEEATERIERHLDTEEVHDLLLGNLEHPRWDDIAQRCLACGNCTLVCPTCFCTTVEDTTDLAGTTANRERRWDSCFSLDFTHTGPASVRNTTRARYRQWLTHKLATWIDQFDTSGCVGCGRCITWCPVGIDLTAEVATIQRTTEDPAAPARS